VNFKHEQWKTIADGIKVSNFGRLASKKKDGWYYHTPSRGWCIPTYRRKMKEWGCGGPYTSSMHQIVRYWFGAPAIEMTEENLNKVVQKCYDQNKKNGTDKYYKQIGNAFSRKKYNTTHGRKPSRKCNPCGKPTDYWRCPKCWEKINAENGITGDEDHPDDWYRAGIY